ncbi:MAG: hypothetical protein WCT49_01180 [Candidatus Paceibacterota bacterium]|jgi:hypothetical protein|nr:hypothetical protein [Candidatus Paceibacterota bacterium]
MENMEKDLDFEEQGVKALEENNYEQAFDLFRKHEASQPKNEDKGMAWGEPIEEKRMPRSEIVARNYWIPEELRLAKEATENKDFAAGSEHFKKAEHIYRDLLGDEEGAVKAKEEAVKLGYFTEGEGVDEKKAA